MMKERLMIQLKPLIVPQKEVRLAHWLFDLNRENPRERIDLSLGQLIRLLTKMKLRSEYVDA